MTEPGSYPSPPPGWHADPWAPGGYRWWDGTSWTALVSPAPSTPGVPAPWTAAPTGPMPAVADARRWCDYAAKAMVAWAAVIAIQAFSLPFVFASLFEDIRELNEDGTTSSTTTFGTNQSLASIPLNVGGLISFAALIVLALWTYNGAKAMEATGHRTTHSPGWAAAGWFVPIISLWFPFQAARDLIPINHPMRRRVGWWWACWLLSGIATFVPIIAAWFSLGASLLAAIVPITLAVAGGMLGSQVAKAAGDGFDELTRKVAAWTG